MIIIIFDVILLMLTINCKLYSIVCELLPYCCCLGTNSLSDIRCCCCCCCSRCRRSCSVVAAAAAAAQSFGSAELVRASLNSIDLCVLCVTLFRPLARLARPHTHTNLICIQQQQQPSNIQQTAGCAHPQSFCVVQVRVCARREQE